MRGRTALLAIAVVALMADPAEGGALRRKIVVGEVRLDRSLPPDLVSPEGRTRWELGGLEHGRLTTLTLQAEDRAVTLAWERPGEAPVERFVDTGVEGSDDALLWHFPDRDSERLRPGARHTFEIDRETPSGLERLRIQVDNAGIGWIHLPSGPREAILQRALVLTEPGRGAEPGPATLVHRWVDPRAGIVAEISGPAAPGGRGRLAVTAVTALEQMLEGASMLTISVSELAPREYSGLLFGFDRGPGTTVASLDPAGYTTIGDLIAQDVWNFSGNTTGTEIAYTVVPVDANQTCNTASCGFGDPNALLQRNDIGFDSPDTSTWTKILTALAREDRANDVTLWLRAGSVNEGATGSFGQGETRFCHVTFGGRTRTPVPLWRFSHPGATERFFQPGDSWSAGPFNCEQTLFVGVCGDNDLTLYAKACGTHTGTQTVTAMKGGVVTLPSGHTFNAILLSNVVDYCVYLGSACSALGKVDEVRTVNYLWQVPHIGTVVRLESEQNAPDTTSFTQVVETNISYGLFPPRSITVTGATDTTVSISWDPGLLPGRITGYKVYWGPMSGSAGPYAFDSESHPGQASITGTTATISGLAPGTPYFLTVTSLSEYPPDPATPLPRLTYESLLYPTTVSGDPSFVYPAEVQATTTGGTCIPTAEVADLSATHQPGGIEICWDPVTDPCLIGYRVLGSASPVSDAGFGTVAEPGVQTCWSGDPSDVFYLVTAKGTGGDGPWGHYGR